MTTARVLSLWWIFAAATAMSLFSAALAYNISPPQTPGFVPPSLSRLVVLNSVYWYLWALFAPIIGWLAVTFRLEKARWKTSVPVHLAAVLFFATAHITLVNAYQYLTRIRPWRSSFATVLRGAIIQNIDWEMMTYWVIVGVTHAVLYYRESQQRTLTAAQLEAKLAASQLQNLQAQLHPHFFFNTLHAISALMHRDVGAADRMLTRLSDLLRLSLERVGVSEVPLKDELEFLEKYVEIECTRFQDRLTVNVDVAPEALDAMVPNLLLQPIVENAIRHGIAPRSGPGRVDVIAKREGDRLWMEVRDDGVGLSEDALVALQKGIGVSTTRARLECQYGSQFRFEFLRLPAGLAVRVVIPWRTSPAPIGELSLHERKHA